MSMQSQIFQTSSPSRWKKVQWTTRIILMIFLFLMAVVFIALIRAAIPSQLNYDQQSKEYANTLDPSKPLTFAHSQNKKYKGFKDFLEKKTLEDSLKSIKRFYADTTNKNPYIRAAFYTPWNQNASTPDLEQYGADLNTIFPEWFFNFLAQL